MYTFPTTELTLNVAMLETVLVVFKTGFLTSSFSLTICKILLIENENPQQFIRNDVLCPWLNI